MARPEALRAHEADEKRHPVMREIAKLALARRFTQESLAKAWREASGGGRIRGRNVKAHFEVKVPREDTVRRYADVLGVKPEYLLLLHSDKFEDANAVKHGHSDPAGASERYWLNMLRLQFETDEWEPDAAEAITRYLQELEVGERRRYLESFALAWYREEYLGEPVFAGRVAREAFEANAPPELQLAQRRRKRVPGEKSFVRLWEAVAEILHPYPSEIDAVLVFVRALYQAHGIDVAPMDAELDNDIPYRQWRDGRLGSEAWQ